MSDFIRRNAHEIADFLFRWSWAALSVTGISGLAYPFALLGPSLLSAFVWGVFVGSAAGGVAACAALILLLIYTH